MSKALKKKRTGEGKRLTPVPYEKLVNSRDSSPNACPHDTMRFEVQFKALDPMIKGGRVKKRDVIAAIRQGIVDAIDKALGAGLDGVPIPIEPHSIPRKDKDTMHSEMICIDLS